jgi:hypothetical protein
MRVGEENSRRAEARVGCARIHNATAARDAGSNGEECDTLAVVSVSSEQLEHCTACEG